MAVCLLLASSKRDSLPLVDASQGATTIVTNHRQSSFHCRGRNGHTKMRKRPTWRWDSTVEAPCSAWSPVKSNTIPPAKVVPELYSISPYPVSCTCVGEER